MSTILLINRLEFSVEELTIQAFIKGEWLDIAVISFPMVETPHS